MQLIQVCTEACRAGGTGLGEGPMVPPPHSHKGQLLIVGFDAADVVRRGAAQCLHQPVQGGSELQSTMGRWSGPVGGPGGSPGTEQGSGLPRPVPGWRWTSCSSGCQAETCGWGGRAAGGRWTCGTAGTRPHPPGRARPAGQTAGSRAVSSKQHPTLPQSQHRQDTAPETSPMQDPNTATAPTCPKCAGTGCAP